MPSGNDSFEINITDALVCKGLQSCRDKVCSETFNFYDLGYLLDYYPALSAILDIKKNLIMSNGLVLKDNSGKVSKNNEKLQNWLLKSNSEDVTHLLVLESLIKDAEFYGRSALRFFSENLEIKNILATQYIVLTIDKSRGQREIVGYLVNENGFKSKADETKTLEEVSDTDYSDKYKVLKDSNELLNFKINTKSINGDSPFLSDRARIQLTMDSLLQSVKDVNNEGFGKAIIYIKSLTDANTFKMVFGREINEVINHREELEETIRNKYAEIKASLKKSFTGQTNKDSAVIMDMSLIEKVEFIKPTKQAFDYYEQFQDEAVSLAAQVLGLHPSIVGVKNSSYQTSITSILEFVIQNAIKPRQQIYANILNSKLLPLLGFDGDRIEFQSYNLNNPEDLQKINGMVIDNALKLQQSGVELNKGVKYAEKYLQEDLNSDSVSTNKYIVSGLNPESTVSI